MVLTALRGALGFLTRLPTTHRSDAWEAFRTTPAAFPIAGYLLGALLILPLLLPTSAPPIVFGFLVWLYLLTGITHLDGLADLADAAVAHGTPSARRDIMTDTTTGVGGTLAIALTITGLALAAFAITSLPRRAVLIVLAAEVGAKLAMATTICLGTAAHDGLGAQFTHGTAPKALIVPIILTLPATAVTIPSIAAPIALLTATIAGVGITRWATSRLGGVTGDVIGASNELARLTALHTAILAWPITY